MRRSPRSGRPSFAAAAAATVAFALIVQVFSVAAAQHATPVASPVAAASVGTLPPAWLEFGPDGELFARVIVAGECPPTTCPQ
jgi:hypothetical protein